MSIGSNSRPILLGHRGCRLPEFHENTFRAFEHALESGCDGFEFDVRLTADRHPVCVHDASLGKCLVESSTLDELVKERMKSAGTPPGSGVCCLEDVVRRFGNSAFLDIELKVSGMESQVLEILQRQPPSRSYFISSFLPEVVCRLEEMNSDAGRPPVDLGFLFDDLAGLRTWPNMPGPWIVPRHDLVSRDLVKAVHADGRKLATWTVNGALEMARLAEWGVDAIVSDDPAALSRTIRGL